MSPLLGAPNRGYADWQRVENWDTGTVWQDTVLPTHAITTSPVMDMSRSAYLGAYVQYGLGDVLFNIDWANDAAMSDFVGGRSFTMSAATTNGTQMRLPNMGSFAQITIDPLTAGNYSVAVNAWGTNRVQALEFIPQSPYLLQHANIALAANATNYYTPIDSYSGPIQVNATSPLGFTFRLEALNTADGWDTLVVVPTAANVVINQTFIAPPSVWRVGMQQTTGAATAETMRVVFPTTGSS